VIGTLAVDGWAVTFGTATHCGSKREHTVLLSVTLPKFDRLSKFFHWHT